MTAPEPQPAPGFARWMATMGDALDDGTYTAADMAAAYTEGQHNPLGGVLPDDAQPAPELAAAMAETRDLRELVLEILAATRDSAGRPVAQPPHVIRSWRKRAGLTP